MALQTWQQTFGASGERDTFPRSPTAPNSRFQPLRNTQERFGESQSEDI